MTSPLNLDYLCAARGGLLVEYFINKAKLKSQEAANHVQKSMGILQEDGLYAFAVYQQYREKRGGSALLAQIPEFLLKDCRVGEHSGLFSPAPDPATSSPDLLSLTKEISQQSLDRLFLARDLIMRVLVYAYYLLRSEKDGTGVEA